MLVLSVSWILACPGDRTAIRRFQIFLILFPQEIEEVRHDRIDQKVTSQTPIHVIINQSGLSEQPQMLGYVRLAGFKIVLEIADALHAIFKLFENLDSQWVADYFQDFHPVPLDIFLARFHIDNHIIT